MSFSLSELIRQDPIFWFAALTGSLLFILQLLLSFLGTEGHDDMDTNKIKWLSKQALTGFLMMFGWVGLTCKKEFGLSIFPTTLIAFVGGTLAVLFTALIFNFAKKLRSSGTVFRLEDAIGKQAIVYQKIPKGGVGKISLSLNELTYEVDAISQLDEDLASFQPVQILKISDEKTVVVIPTQ